MRAVGATVLGVLGVGAAAAMLVHALAGSGGASDAAAIIAQSSAVETHTVQHSDLIAEVSSIGEVGYGEPIVLAVDGEGVVTASQVPGAVVAPGEVLMSVAGRPVHLADGSMPLFRELRRVRRGERDEAGDPVGVLSGDDVAQLQRFLIDSGFDDQGRLEADGSFGPVTERSVRAWQTSVGHPATGRVDRSQLVFHDGPVRVASAPDVGTLFAPPTVTSTVARVTADVAAADADVLAVGSRVALEAVGVEAFGTVTSTTPLMSDDGQRLRVVIEPDPGADAAAIGSAMSVQIRARRIVVVDAVHVPVRALVVLADGGWALQQSGVGLVPVELLAVVDGRAQIDGVDEGTVVEVPA